MSYPDAAVTGPQINLLTAAAHCDPLAKTPYYKFLPVRLRGVGPAAS